MHARQRRNSSIAVLQPKATGPNAPHNLSRIRSAREFKIPPRRPSFPATTIAIVSAPGSQPTTQGACAHAHDSARRRPQPRALEKPRATSGHAHDTRARAFAARWLTTVASTKAPQRRLKHIQQRYIPVRSTAAPPLTSSPAHRREFGRVFDVHARMQSAPASTAGRRRRLRAWGAVPVEARDGRWEHGTACQHAVRMEDVHTVREGCGRAPWSMRRAGRRVEGQTARWSCRSLRSAPAYAGVSGGIATSAATYIPAGAGHGQRRQLERAPQCTLRARHQ